MLIRFFTAAVLLTSSAWTAAQSLEVSTADSPEMAVRKFAVAPGLQVSIWAAEPLVINPVALAFDHRGRAYVAETARRRSSVPDIRKNMDWLAPVLAARTVEDRAEFLKATYPEGAARVPTSTLQDLNADGQFDWRDWAVESERLRLVEDRDGDGKADAFSVFAEGFNSLETGIGAGVAVRGNEVWYACAPNLWKLTPGGEKKSLVSGFGIHVSYSGHDLHGVKFGPDGKLYWTVADCGALVNGLHVQDTGAVFRANPDGTQVEVVATGLRNPQSLAFNDVGDLFTGDNNADGGDKARWVHVVEGGDYGWRVGWQFLPKLGEWNSEALWELDVASRTRSVLPAVGHIGHGPAGITYYPGTGLPESYQEHFFYADFPGGIRSFALERKGASYTVSNPGDVLSDNTPAQMEGKLLWNLYPSDVAFGVDGGLYVLDWVAGWEKTGKGRIYRVHSPEVDQSAVVLETKRLLSGDFASMPEAELVALLGHADQRVRIEAQWALAAKNAIEPLREIALRGEVPVARLHAIWGLGQIASHDGSSILEVATELMTDADAEVRAQTLKAMTRTKTMAVPPAPRVAPRTSGAAPVAPPVANHFNTLELMTAALSDPEPRVRFHAALGLSSKGSEAEVPALTVFLLDRVGDDAYLQHAGGLALRTCADEKTLAGLAGHASPQVRAAALAALRQLGSGETRQFLTSGDPVLASDAARAIHDVAASPALPALAALPIQRNTRRDIARRVINANMRLGTVESAQRLASLAGSDSPNPTRLDALDALQQWNGPHAQDRVLGLWHALPEGRDPVAAGQALSGVLPALLLDVNPEIAQASAEAATSLRLLASETVLLGAAANATLRGTVRAATLRALASFDSPRLGEAVQAALRSGDKAVLAEARRLSARLSPALALQLNGPVIESGSVPEQQGALKILAGVPGAEIDALFAGLLDQVTARALPRAIWLDVLEGATARKVPAMQAMVAAQGGHEDCLEGGDAKRGKQIFYERAEAACLRCHKVRGEGGDVGPDLGFIAKTRDRAYLLESILMPNVTIAPGYENLMLTLGDGNLIAGTLMVETESELTVTQLADGKKVTVPKATVTQREKMPSSMPEGLGNVLGKRDLRDVVEYLAGLK